MDAVRREATSQRVAQLLGVKLRGDGTGCCPLHEDTNPSFKAYPDGGGWKCFACEKTGGDGISLWQSRHGGDFPEAVRSLATQLGIPADLDGNGLRPGRAPAARKPAPAAPPSEDTKLWAPCPEPPAGLRHFKHGPVAGATRFDIRDSSGHRFEVKYRWDRPNGKKDFASWRGGWGLFKLPEVGKGAPKLLRGASPLYRSEKLNGGRSGLVVLVEGEKKADILAEKTGAQVLGTTTGASGEHCEAALSVLDRWDGPVMVWADNDPPTGRYPRGIGRQHADRHAEALRRRGLRVVVYQDQDSGDGGDAVEWLARQKDSHGPEELLAELVRIAEELAEQQPAQPSEPAPAIDTEPSVRALCLVGVSWAEFVSKIDQVPPPFLGSEEGPILPQGGLMLVYGDGGAGKTTLMLDMVAHLASGTRWLDIPVLQPVRVLMIENEGPEHEFRKKLIRKEKGWKGEPFHNSVVIVSEPWAGVSLAADSQRRELAALVDREHIDVVVIGPLVTIGAKGAGTPDDVNDFADLVAALRRLTARQFALVLVHHENKAGEISGAWTRLPDTLLQVQAQGHGRTRLIWHKVRWCGDLQGVAWNLEWADGDGFFIEQARERDYRGDVLKVFKPGEWLKTEDVKGRARGQQAAVVEALNFHVEAGTLIFLDKVPGRHHRAVFYALPGTEPLQGEIST